MEDIRYRRSKQLLSLKFDTPVLAEKRGDRNWYKLRVYLDGDLNFIQNNIQQVVYFTHPTFPKNMQEITVKNKQGNFPLNLRVWGRFRIRAHVYLTDGEVMELSEFLPALST
jgi:transcription initiation factor IIF auxiliary subunit